MKKTENYVLRQIIDEFVLAPRGKMAEKVKGTMTLSETAAFIYNHLEDVENTEELAEMLGKEYGISKEEVLEDVQEVLDFLKKNEAIEW